MKTHFIACKVRVANRWQHAAPILLGVLLVACDSSVQQAQPLAPAIATPISAGMTAPGPVTPIAMPASTPAVPVAPPVAMNPLAPMAGVAGQGGAGGAAGGAAHSHDPCLAPIPAAPEDAMVTNMPDSWTSMSGSVELVLPKPVQSWMDQRLFKEGHDAWHGVRRCAFIRGIGGSRPGQGGGARGMAGAGASGTGGSTATAGASGAGGASGGTRPPRGGGGFPRSPALALCEKPELVAPEQECEGDQDGYEFLVTHRHMLNELRQAFPTHQELFAGFPKFPLDAQDVPEQWRGRFGNGWSPQILEDAKMLENIETNLDRFPTEGALGKFIQCGMSSFGASSVHGAMHFKWVVSGSPYMLGDSATNLGNYMFWKLHGWIDQIWTRYRTAKGMKEDDPKHVAALVDQCQEMHMLGAMIGPARPMPDSMEPLPVESGLFHEQVRPILEKTCAGCHAGGNPEGSLVLGGRVSSAVIVENLVDVASVRGGQFKRVLAGNPRQSWLYLKASGMAVSAGCTGMCNNQVMPPTGMVTLTPTDLSTIEKWIMDGAAMPTSP